MPWLTNSVLRSRLYVGRSLRKGPKPLERLSKFFHAAGYSVYVPDDDELQNSPAEIKTRDMEAIRSSDIVVLELEETSLGVAQELGAARALGKPVILITRSERVTRHNWIRGDVGIKCCTSKEEALQLIELEKLG